MQYKNGTSHPKRLIRINDRDEEKILNKTDTRRLPKTVFSRSRNEKEYLYLRNIQNPAKHGIKENETVKFSDGTKYSACRTGWRRIN